MPSPINRREALRHGITVLALPLAAGAAAPPAEQIKLRITETAGLRRFGYPVHVVLQNLPEGFADRPLGLLRDQKPVRAQFRKEGTQTVIDFASSVGPLESEEYAVVALEAAAESKGSMSVEQRDNVFRVKSGGTLYYEIPTNLNRLLSQVGNSSKQYIRSGVDLPGIELFDKISRAIDVGKFTGSIVYQGPLACALQFESEAKNKSGVAARVRLHFPSTKSWVEATVSLNDPLNHVNRIRVSVPLDVDGTPTLVDLGANDTVYGQIKGKEVMTLQQGPSRSWKVELGTPDALKSFAVSVPDEKSRAEGWAHVMDRQRCTAVAVAEFGKDNGDQIEAHADGTLRLDRRFFTPVSRPKEFRFWLHFVPMPVQVGAATSPQAMLAPLKVQVL